MPWWSRSEGSSNGSLTCPEKISEKRKIVLAFSDRVCYYMVAVKRGHNFRVWRSLVSRLNGVQEAAGSNPVTRTKREETIRFPLFFYALSREPAASCRDGGAFQSAVWKCRAKRSISHWFKSSHSDHENRRLMSTFFLFSMISQIIYPWIDDPRFFCVPVAQVCATSP